MASYQHGDVVRVIVEFSDASGEKRRPGLVISDPLLNESADYTIIPIFTRAFRRAGDYTLQESDAEFKQTGLDHTSTFRCHLLFPVKESRVVKKFGEVGPGTMQELEKRLRVVLGL